MQTADYGSPTRPAAPSPAILAVRGGSARLEGKFDIEDSIEVQCELSGELTVGGTMIIGEAGTVSADVKTVNAIILGTYNGNLVASGSIEIAATGRVSGTLESNELVIAKGGIFTGSVARSSAPAVAATRASAGTSEAGSTARESTAEPRVALGATDRAAEPAAAFDEASQPAAAQAATSDGEIEDITAISPISELDELSDVSVPVIPTLADRSADETAPRTKQSGRLQSITLS